MDLRPFTVELKSIKNRSQSQCTVSQFSEYKSAAYCDKRVPIHVSCDCVTHNNGPNNINDC